MKKKHLINAIKEFGKDFEKNLKKLAPVAIVNGGTLKKSIKTFADIQRDTVKAGVEMIYYGEYVKERGTHNKVYNPFKEDAWQETRFNADVDKELEKYLDEEFEKVFT